jgi:hypothetical protein
LAVRGIEPIIDKIVALIKSDINAQLAVVEADNLSHPTPIVLPRPLNECYYITQKAVLEQLPAVLVIGERSIHNVRTESATYDTQDSGGGHELSITWVDRHDNEEILRRTLFRSARALHQLFLEKFDLEGTVMYIQVTTEDYFPNTQFDGDSAYYQAVQLQLTAQIEEVF